MNLYSDRNPMDLEPHYSAHVSAMTSEGLHDKADIAAELAFMDARIAELEGRLLTMLTKVHRDEIYKHDLVALAMDGAVASDGCHTAEGSRIRRTLDALKKALRPFANATRRGTVPLGPGMYTYGTSSACHVTEDAFVAAAMTLAELEHKP